eukprot:1882983-Amphidinium_carterae.1
MDASVTESNSPRALLHSPKPRPVEVTAWEGGRSILGAHTCAVPVFRTHWPSTAPKHLAK